MTDLITYANSSLEPAEAHIDYSCSKDRLETYHAAWESTQTGHMPSSSRCNVWRRFIKEHGGLSDGYFHSKVAHIPDERRLVGKDEERSELHPAARTFPTLTVSNVLKYMPEQALQWAALSMCYPAYELSWVLIGLDSKFCKTDSSFSSGFVLGLSGVPRNLVTCLHNHAIEGREAPTTTPEPTTDLPDLEPAVQAMLDATLSGAGVPSYEELRTKLNTPPPPPPSASGVSITIGDYTLPTGSGELPDMTAVKTAKLSSLGLPTKHDMHVPTFEWSFTHPDVPAIDETYHFREDLVDSLAYSITTNERVWLHGHTGTGKSSLVDQVAARLGYPVVRVNFDGEISRMDLIGREVLRQEDGTTVSTFVDGIIPNAMQRPCILLLDEIDFVRTEVSYVLQRLLETNGELVITEDGGRRVKADPMFRIVATANTQGHGNETGHYPGARTQSAAFLDRFTVWGEVKYLNRDQIEAMTGNSTIAAYYQEHTIAFLDGQIDLPLSPRGLMAWSTMGKALDSTPEAFEATLLNRANEADRAVMQGIWDRFAE